MIMKNLLFAVAGTTLMLAAACSKEEGKTGNNNSSVDVECTVNGREWKMGKNDSFNIDGMPGNKGAAVVATLRGNNLSFSLNRWDNTDSAAVVITAVLTDTAIGNYAFDFANDPANMHYIRYIKMDRSMGPPPDMVNSVGFLKITAYNKTTRVCSGEFEAVVTNRNFRGQLSTVNISKGKFTDIPLK